MRRLILVALFLTFVVPLVSSCGVKGSLTLPEEGKEAGEGY